MQMFRMFVVSKEEVLDMDTSRIKKIVDGISSSEARLALAQGQYELLFWGYDDDPRELPEIPEVREWVKKSIREIPWLYFLRFESPNFRVLNSCLGYVETVRDGGGRPKHIIDIERWFSYVDDLLDTFFRFCRFHNIPQGVVDDVGASLQAIPYAMTPFA